MTYNFIIEECYRIVYNSCLPVIIQHHAIQPIPPCGAPSSLGRISVILSRAVLYSKQPKQLQVQLGVQSLRANYPRASYLLLVIRSPCLRRRHWLNHTDTLPIGLCKIGVV